MQFIVSYLNRDKKESSAPGAEDAEDVAIYFIDKSFFHQYRKVIWGV